jgi:hypothetical protein
MPGAFAANLHEGSRSEILADYLFSTWGTVTPVRLQDDYGVDLYCTLSDRVGHRAVVSGSFVVQVKSTTDPWTLGDKTAVEWLVKYPTPLFLACVDKKNAILRVYHVTPRFYVRAMGKLPNRLVLKPGQEIDGKFIEWQNGEEFSLSAPIIQATIADLISAEKLDALEKVFKFWVQIDRENCDLARQGLLRFRMPPSYRVNQRPDGFVGEIGYAAPEAEFLDRGILTTAEGAECIGGQLARLGDLGGALRAALLVDHLRKNHDHLFKDLPRWSRVRLPGDLGMIICEGLNKALSEEGDSNYLYRGIEEIEKALDSNPLVKQFLATNSTIVGTATSGSTFNGTVGAASSVPTANDTNNNSEGVPV